MARLFKFCTFKHRKWMYAIYNMILTSGDMFTMNFATRSERLQLVPGYAMVIRRC